MHSLLLALFAYVLGADMLTSTWCRTNNCGYTSSGPNNYDQTQASSIDILALGRCYLRCNPCDPNEPCVNTIFTVSNQTIIQTIFEEPGCDQAITSTFNYTCDPTLSFFMGSSSGFGGSYRTPVCYNPSKGLSFRFGCPYPDAEETLASLGATRAALVAAAPGFRIPATITFPFGGPSRIEQIFIQWKFRLVFSEQLFLLEDQQFIQNQLSQAAFSGSWNGATYPNAYIDYYHSETQVAQGWQYDAYLSIQGQWSSAGQIVASFLMSIVVFIALFL